MVDLVYSVRYATRPT